MNMNEEELDEINKELDEIIRNSLPDVPENQIESPARNKIPVKRGTYSYIIKFIII